VPTYRLETFGKLALSGGATGSLSHQRRRLALLALLAAAGDRGLSRDALLLYLWPDSTAENGRHSLEQLLHALRRSLGDSVFNGVNPVRLDRDVVASDVDDFERALARGALAEAVDLYRGPFLDGFYLNDEPEFERWTSSERSRLADRYTEALTRLAVDAEKAGDQASAVNLRRRLADVDPVSSRSALALMRALVAAGDRTAALQHARVYEVLVQQELGSAPDPSIAKYAAALRAEVVAPKGEIESTVPKTLPRVDETPIESVGAPPTAAAAAGDGPPVQTAPREAAPTPSPEARRKYWVPAAVFIGVGVLLFAALARRDSDNVPALDSNKIVIVPFRTSGVDSSLKYLGEGVVDLIAPMLTGEGGPIAVDSRTAISTWNRITNGREGTADDARQVARAVGAGLVLSGAVVANGRTLTITGNVISEQTGETRPLTSISAPIDSLDRLLDRFVGQLLTRQSGVAEASVSAVTSQSLPAIRAYLDGRAAYRRANEAKAIESFSRALDIDSTFALAALDLTVATGKMLRSRFCLSNICRVYSVVPGLASSERTDDLFKRAVQLAWAYRFKLGRRDRPLLDALRGNNYPQETTARETLAGLERAVAAAPDRPETHYLLGVLLLYQGQALGLNDPTGRAEAAFNEASQLDSSYLAPLARMVDLAAFTRDTSRLRREAALYLSRDTIGPTADYVRWLLAAGTGDVTVQRAISARLRSFSRATLEQIFLTSQMAGVALDDADSATNIIAESSSDPIEKSVALRRGQLLMLNRGRPFAANAFLRRVDQLRQPGTPIQSYIIASALFTDGERSAGDSAANDLAHRVARDSLGALNPDAIRRVSTALSVLSLWYAERGDTARARTAAAWLQRHVEGQPRNRVLAALPEMMIASRARRSDAGVLIRFVDSAALDGCCAIPEYFIPVLARSYEQSGDPAGALRVIRRELWYNPPRQLAPLLREEGRLAASFGDRAGAIRAYEHYLALRTDPEPIFRPERDRIRAEVNRLKRGR
jgi:DNA-binding SARP family transcriptional activator/TolB-like protein